MVRQSVRRFGRRMAAGRRCGLPRCAAVGTALLAAVVVGLLAGCRKSSQSETAGSFDGTQLRVLVAGDAALGEAIGRLQGQWQAETGGRFEVTTADGPTSLVALAGGADVVVYPSHELAPLAEADLLLPLEDSVRDSPELAWNEVFELLKLHQVRWGERKLAVSLGEVNPVCYYRADLLRKLDRPPPQTWREYTQLALLLSDRRLLGLPDDAAWCGAAEPLAAPWGALMLLARAAPYVKHREHYSALFNIDTMAPAIASPPVVRALEEMVQARHAGPADAQRLGPSEVRQLFYEGRCGMALVWPTAAAAVPDPPADFAVGLAALPGGDEVFHPTRQAWEEHPQRVPLLAWSGRLASVTVHCEGAQRAAAQGLLVFLAGQRLGTRLAAASSETTLYRSSQVLRPQRWVEKPLEAAAGEYAEMVRDTFSRGDWLDALRIPGRQEYLAALQEGVEQALAGQQTPQVALARVAQQWEEITRQRGAQRQRRAYQRNLGILP